MSNSALERYVEIKQQIAALEKEMDELKGEVFKVVEGDDGSYEGDGFVIKTQKRPKYSFSSAYEAKNNELKELKKMEIENGTAKIESYTEFVTVRFVE